MHITKFIKAYNPYYQPPPPQFTEVDGLKFLKYGNTIAAVALFLSVILNITFEFFDPTISYVNQVIGAILLLISLIFFYKGFGMLRYFNSSFGIGSLGSLVLMPAIAIGIIGGALALWGVTNLELIFLLSILYFLLGLTGLILLGIGLRRVGQHYNEQNLSTGGILVATLVIAPIGFILAYFGLDAVINNLLAGGGSPAYTPSPMGPSAPQYTPPSTPSSSSPPPPPVTISPGSLVSPGASVGGGPINIEPVYAGALRSNGTFKLIIRSTGAAKILSIKVEGTDIEAVSINPPTISPGENTIRGNLNKIVAFQQNVTYNVILTVDTGRMIQTFKIPSYYIP